MSNYDDNNRELTPEERIDLFINRENNTILRSKPKYWLHILLFIATFCTVTLGGVLMANANPYELQNFHKGLLQAVLIMSIITAHEFGHFFAAKIHKIDVTPPFYIPFPFVDLVWFGTFGAVIRIKSRITSRKALFDIAVAGPIAGFVVTLIILLIGFITLPGIEFLYNIHPEYASMGVPATGDYSFGYNLLFWTFEKIFTSSPAVFMPPMHEIYHYPFLCAGWFGLLITSLNMLPVGQLDGGHISYTMFGEKSKFIAYVTFAWLAIFGLLGLFLFWDIQIPFASPGWLLWAILIFFIIKVKHPPLVDNMNEPLGKTRIILGWLSYLIFLISFCPVPIS